MTPATPEPGEVVRAVPACPACGAASSAARALFDLPMLDTRARVLSCADCGLIYKSLAPTPAGLARIYGTEYVHFQGGDASGDQELNWARAKLDRACALLAPKRAPRDVRVLDIGCGRGAFVAIARRLGYAAEGIDPYLPEALEGGGLRRLAPEDVAPASYDVAILLNVAEHLVEPRPLFSAIRRLLRPDGVLLLNCPYGDSLARRAHRAQWTHVVLDEHLLFWTQPSLTRFLRSVGFAGPLSYRIGGSPFPYGHVAPAPPVKAGEAVAAAATAPRAPQAPPLSHRIQRAVWRVAREIQRHERVSNAVRALVHTARLGDYLELAIRAG